MLILPNGLKTKDCMKIRVDRSSLTRVNLFDCFFYLLAADTGCCFVMIMNIYNDFKKEGTKYYDHP